MALPQRVSPNGTSIGGTSSSSLTLNYPSGSVNGDLLVVQIQFSMSATGSGSIGPSNLTGGGSWNLLYAKDDTASNALYVGYLWCFRGAETSVTIAPTASKSLTIVDASIVAYQGSTVDASSPIVFGDSFYNLPSGGSASAFTVPSTTTPYNDCEVLAMGMSNGFTATTQSVVIGSPATEILDSSYDLTSSSHWEHWAAYISKPTAGASGSFTVDPDQSSYLQVGTVFVIKPPKPEGTYTDTLAGSGTFTVPAGVASVFAQGIGGGGAGAGAGSNSARPGGAGGAYSGKTFTVTPGTTFSYSTGAAGAAGSGNGGNGGNSWFGSNDASGMVAAGGAGATTSAVGTGTTSGSYGDTVYAGGSGALNNGTTAGGGGGGGAGTSGAGGNASGSTGGTGTATGGGNGGNGQTGSGAGAAGSNYGGGGGGGRNSSFFGTQNGGAGGTGIVTVTYTIQYSTQQDVSDSGSTSEVGKIALSRADTATLTDTATVAATVKPTDTAGTAETAKVFIYVYETMGMVESTPSLVVKGTDTAGAVENTPQLTLSGTDSAGALDETQIAALKDVFDLFSSTELAGLAANGSDTVTLTDLANTLIGVNKQADDSATFTENAQIASLITAVDAITAVDTAQVTVKGTDTAGAVESQTMYENRAFTVNELVTWLEQAKVIVNGTDTASASEDQQLASLMEASDSWSVVDSAKVLISATDTLTGFEYSSVRVNGRIMSPRVYVIPPEERKFAVPPERRTHTVLPEDRKYTVARESRVFYVEKENRRYDR